MRFGEKLRLFLRLHCIQLFWNFKGMQNLGCLHALRPTLERLHAGEELTAAERRHVQFFNTHPYFAPICVGVVARLEEDLRTGKFNKPEMIPVLKNRMSGPLAAVGDAYFWETIRPVLAAFIVLAVYVFGPLAPVTGLVFAYSLGIYVLHVEAIRWNGLGWGYEHGLSVVELLKRKDFQGSMKKIRNVAGVLLGVATVIFMIGGADDPPGILLRTSVLLLLVAATMRKWSPTTLLYLVSAAGFAWGYFS